MNKELVLVGLVVALVIIGVVIFAIGLATRDLELPLR